MFFLFDELSKYCNIDLIFFFFRYILYRVIFSFVIRYISLF